MLRLGDSQAVPPETARAGRAAFPKDNPYLILRDEFGSVFQDEDFVDLYPRRGPPALPPWRLALATLLQYRENLSDRQAAEAVRARIDVKYLLGLPLADADFDFSALSEFRARLREGGRMATLLDRPLERCRELGLVRAGGRAPTDATRVLAAVRVMNRLELVAETLRATLNELARAAPMWLKAVAPGGWSGSSPRSPTAS